MEDFIKVGERHPDSIRAILPLNTQYTHVCTDAHKHTDIET